MSEMIICNNIYYIGFEEKWKIIKYKDVLPNTYEVSNIGRSRIKKTKKILRGNNPSNEKGYCRIAFKSIDGKIKKYQMHRIVLSTFGKLKDDEEVNHIDGCKLNNEYSNLEPSSRFKNAHHAAINNLYENCDRRYNASFTNSEVHEICKRLSNGEAISKIINDMNLKDRGSIYSNIDKIISGKSWKKIRSQYIIDPKLYHYKTYKYDDIITFCDCIFNKKMKNREIIELFPQYNSKNLNTALKGIRAGRIYKQITCNFMSSTTRES